MLDILVITVLFATAYIAVGAAAALVAYLAWGDRLRYPWRIIFAWPVLLIVALVGLIFAGGCCALLGVINAYEWIAAQVRKFRTKKEAAQ